MENVIEKIWSYGILSDIEKKELEAFVSVNTEYAPVLEDSRSIHALLGQAGILVSDSVDEVALAYLVAHTQVVPEKPPVILQKAFESLHDKIEAMPEVKERYSKMKVRMEEVAMSSDPVSQFEQLTGLSIEQDFESSKAREHSLKREFAKDRPGILGRRLVGYKKHVLRFNVVLVGCLIVFFAGYYSNRIARHAYSGADILLLDGIFEERGGNEYDEPVSPDVVFALAQRALFESQNVWLGVYYSYDEVKLTEVEKLFEKVLQDSSSSPFLQEESTYLLAKISMAKKDYPKAIALLDELIGMRGRRMEEAQGLRSLL